MLASQEGLHSVEIVEIIVFLWYGTRFYNAKFYNYDHLVISLG